MNQSSFKKPGRVELARTRLDQAIDRLEQALLDKPDAAQSEVPNAAPMDVGVSADELAAAQRENSRLRAANENVSERLDATIDRLEILLSE